MFQESLSNTAPDTLSKVTARFAAWRNAPKRSKKIPEDLWQAAVELSNQYSINQISKALRLSYTYLKKMRIHLHGKTDPDLYELSRAFWNKQS